MKGKMGECVVWGWGHWTDEYHSHFCDTLWVPYNHNTTSKALPRDFLSRWSFSHLFSSCCRICQSILKQKRAAWKILLSIVIPSKKLIAYTELSSSWSMSNLHATLVSLPGLSLFHAIYGRLPAIQPCHWQGLVPVTYANETNKQKILHKTSLGTGLKRESWSVIYFLALMSAKTFNFFMGWRLKAELLTPMGLDINKFTLTKSTWDILYPKLILHLSFSVFHLQEVDIWHAGDTLIKSFCDSTGTANM